jgi:hypothetical protein
VDIEEFGPGWLGPKELAVIVDPEDNPALVEQLKKKYVEAGVDG